MIGSAGVVQSELTRMKAVISSRPKACQADGTASLQSALSLARLLSLYIRVTEAAWLYEIMINICVDRELERSVDFCELVHSGRRARFRGYQRPGLSLTISSPIHKMRSLWTWVLGALSSVVVLARACRMIYLARANGAALTPRNDHSGVL
ncbi:hypothetical protein EVAR_60440_1 [Eumeta japonica]|uniref:Uncharacterized protein n=1 Tax=Eumeta variegata TaxID=151549 RepID=A0A4C1Z0W6_EUMVA|nr:hypothetical protein EVAR_60440_1 [Eumeta japonica]